MKVLMISGSRNREGRTARAMEALARGIEKGGATAESVFLTELKLERCRQCHADGWGVCRNEGYCVIEDDFAGVVEKIKASDVVVFANPVYFFDLTESMRAFLDRFRRISAFVQAKPTDGISAAGICLAGGGGGGAPNACVNLERVLQVCGFDVVDMIPMRRQNFEVKLPILELTGEWLATKPDSKGE